MANASRDDQEQRDGVQAVERVLKALDLDQLDRDLYLGDPGHGKFRLFGGLVAAQSTIAAGRTVENDAEIHSLHALATDYLLSLGFAVVSAVEVVEKTRGREIGPIGDRLRRNGLEAA